MSLPGKRILIVEDELLIALEVSDFLSDFGCEVIGPASSLKEARALIGEAEKLDGAVLDISIKGEKVFPLAEVLREKKIPFVFATGYDRPNLTPPFDGYTVLKKPYSKTELHEGLKGLLE